MSYEPYYYLNRTLCDVLEEMRKSNKTRNYASLHGLIEEAQIMGNRMESGLDAKKDIQTLLDEKSKIWKQVKKLRKECKKLSEKEDE